MSGVSIERIENAIRIVAVLIQKSGNEAYWPILERLEAERDALLSRQTRLARYLSERNAMTTDDAAKPPATASPAVRTECSRPGERRHSQRTNR
ncbi:MAG: hypothetical protein B7X53_01120 [Hyphomonas sp. 34-62-18]|nr:MAG: hypothetical protein B7X53_01120 [Hyphomonas sp. 34-62-18]